MQEIKFKFDIRKNSVNTNSNLMANIASHGYVFGMNIVGEKQLLVIRHNEALTKLTIDPSTATSELSEMVKKHIEKSVLFAFDINHNGRSMITIVSGENTLSMTIVGYGYAMPLFTPNVCAMLMNQLKKITSKKHTSSELMDLSAFIMSVFTSPIWGLNNPYWCGTWQSVKDDVSGFVNNILFVSKQACDMIHKNNRDCSELIDAMEESPLKDQKIEEMLDFCPYQDEFFTEYYDANTDK